jgi:hypothetical protein
MADVASFSAAMKTKFIGPIRDQLHSNKILLFGLRTKDGDKQEGPHASRDFKGIVADATGIDFVGNEFRMPLRTSRNQGTGPRGESSTLPAPGNQGYKYISEALKYFYGLFNITGPLLKAADSNEGAFRKALQAEMEGLTDDLKRHVNIQAFGSGNGVIGAVSTGASSTTQAVDTTIYFQGGEFVDIYDSTLTTRRNAAGPVQVTAINRSGLTLTVSPTINTTTGDVIIRASSDSSSAAPNNDRSQAINGLQNIVDSTGALHGLNPATAGEGFWSSSEIAAAGATVGDALLRQLKDSIGFESGSDTDTVIITTRGVRNRYANTLTALKRFNDAQAVTLRGGFNALMFDDTPMVYDDHCPLGQVYALNTDAMFWSQMSDWEWMEEDGNVLKWESRLDRYVGVLFKYCNLGTWARNRHGKITGAADDTK